MYKYLSLRNLANSLSVVSAAIVLIFITMSVIISYKNTLKKTKNHWFHWGSNPGPSACEADVIATTL